MGVWGGGCFSFLLTIPMSSSVAVLLCNLYFCTSLYARYCGCAPFCFVIFLPSFILLFLARKVCAS